MDGFSISLVREMHHMRQHGAAGGLVQMSAIIDLICYQKGYLDKERYAIISPGTWKKFITGKGVLKKDTAYLVHLNKAIAAHPMVMTPDNFEIVDDNIADALCLAVTGYAARMLKRGHELPVSKTATTALHKVSDGMFDYGKN